jgi:HEAT repeat protein
MTSDADPRDDPRTVDELVNAVLSEADEEAAWEPVYVLHWRGTREVLLRAKELCGSRCPRERRLGADILGQSGVPDRTFPAECRSQLRGMLKADEEADVLRAVLVALSHQADAEAIPSVIGFSSYPDPWGRHGVVLALTGHEAPLAVGGLVSLSTDPDPLVRDWATFGLGTQLELDTPQIRDALAARLDDPDDDTRAEAQVGLARRKDRRVIDPLKQELGRDSIGRLSVEAAELIASTELHAPLVALREWWDVDAGLLESAIAACSES